MEFTETNYQCPFCENNLFIHQSNHFYVCPKNGLHRWSESEIFINCFAICYKKDNYLIEFNTRDKNTKFWMFNYFETIENIETFQLNFLLDVNLYAETPQQIFHRVQQTYQLLK